jgi:curved DNA-binding protein CbpA
MARKYHPDLNPDNKDTELKFKEINEANEVLGNAENCKKYDQYGEDWKRGNSSNRSALLKTILAITIKTSLTPSNLCLVILARHNKTEENLKAKISMPPWR